MRVWIYIFVLAGALGLLAFLRWQHSTGPLPVAAMTTSEWDVVIGSDHENSFAFQLRPFEERTGVVVEYRVLTARADQPLTTLGGRASIAWMDDGAYEQLRTGRQDPNDSLIPALDLAEAQGLIHHLVLVPRTTGTAAQIIRSVSLGTRFYLQGHEMIPFPHEPICQPCHWAATTPTGYFLVTAFRAE